MKILLVEDDLSLADVISFTLRRAGFELVTVHDGLAALAAWERDQPDLLVLDLNLPKLDGMVVCRRIRAQSNIPILILSVRGGDETVVDALDLGADDYVVKPFSPSQLVARIKALLRRSGITLTPGPLAVADWVLNRSRNELQIKEQTCIRLTPLETRLLEALMLNAGQVLTADSLITTVWGPEGGDRTMLKQLIYRLRAKLEPQTNHIETVTGVGYTLTVSSQSSLVTTLLPP